MAYAHFLIFAAIGQKTKILEIIGGLRWGGGCGRPFYMKCVKIEQSQENLSSLSTLNFGDESFRCSFSSLSNKLIEPSELVGLPVLLPEFSGFTPSYYKHSVTPSKCSQLSEFDSNRFVFYCDNDY